MALEWAMAYGAAEDWLSELAAAGDRAAQKAFATRVEIAPHLLFVWGAFWEIATDRSATVAGVGPIPFSALDRYARRFGLDRVDDFDRFSKLIRRLDAAFLKAKKAKDGG